MRVTKQWLLDNRTLSGAWTKKQADILGMEWPLKKGWMQLVINRELTLDERIDFELARFVESKSKLSKVIGMFIQLNTSEQEMFKRWLNRKDEK